MLSALPVAYLFGISIKDADFFAFWQAIILIFQVVLAATVHPMLLVFRQRSELAEIIKLYTIRMVYIPVIGILNLPATYEIYDKVHVAKQAKMDVWALLSSLMAPAENRLGGLDDIGTALGYGTIFVTTAVFTEAIIAWYGNRRFLSYLAVGSAGAFATLLLIVIGLPLLVLNVYAHVQ